MHRLWVSGRVVPVFCGMNVSKRSLSIAALACWEVWAIDVHDLELALRVMFVLWLTDQWWPRSKGE
jgi:hypothetical protein